MSDSYIVSIVYKTILALIQQAKGIADNIDLAILQPEGRQNIEALKNLLDKAETTINNEISRIQSKGV